MPTTPDTLEAAIARLAAHDHLCLIHESRAEQFAAVVPFISCGLDSGQRCVYIAADDTAGDVIVALRDAGIDTDAETARGALQVITEQESYLRGGRFDPDEMIAFLGDAEKAARDDGFSALRVTGEMTWVLGGEPGADRLFEYEAKLNRFFPDHDALAICQYDRHRFPADVILDVIRTHPVVIAGDAVCDNVYFVPPDQLLQGGEAGPEADRMLTALRETRSSRRALERESRAWSATFDAMKDAVCLLAPDGTVLRCNSAMVGLVDRTADEIVGSRCHDLVHGSGSFIEGCPFQRMLRTGKRESFEMSLGDRWFEVTADPLLGDAEKIVGAVHIIRDISGRKEAERALAAETRSLSLMTGLALDLASLGAEEDIGAFIASRLMEATDAAAAAFSEYDPRERVLTTRNVTLRPGRAKRLVATLLTRLSDVKSPVSDETHAEILGAIVGVRSTLTETSFGAISPRIGATVQRMLGVDRFLGIAFVVEGELFGTAMVGLKKSAPEPPRALLESIAHTAAVSLRRRRVEDELRASEAKARFWAEVVEHAAEAMAMGYPDGRLGDCNQAWCDLTGYTREELGSTDWTTVLTPPEWIEPESAALAELERTGRPVRYEKEIIRKDGGRVPVDMLVHVTRDEQGHALHFTSFVTDISERKRAEATIRALNTDLECRVEERTRDLTIANRRLQEFVYSVSHDLRTPLRALDGFSLDVLERCGDALDEQGIDDLRRVRAAAQRLGRLIDGLLSLATVGHRVPRLEETDLSAVAREVVAELRQAEPERIAEVVIEAGLAAGTDAVLAEIVLGNLLQNVWKFTSHEPVAHIAVGTVVRDGRRAFYVRDNGVGFDPAYARKLFTPFESLHSADEFSGTGVGLATVSRTLESLGGTCWAEGATGEGATFYFVLADAESEG